MFIDIITKAIQNIEGTPNRSNNDHTIITSLTDYKQLKILVENQINISKENILYMFCLNNPVILIDLLGLRLSAGEIAAIVYNETRSLSGAGIDDARALMMYAIINGDEKEATGGSKRPPTAPTVCKCKIKDEQDLYDSLVQLALEVLGNYYEEGEDPTGGSTHFNMRGTPSTTPFMGSPITTHSGPFNNSYTAGGLPSTGVYINTYK